ncbi:MAG: prepilin-type N-terminal cleavage/methylation domain-containing protein [Acidobacteria bacterium]|nr:MAG: prepilin-type N-terminal cleavage/methylation domain-containing protein [Acidobacteriota bacterium]
MSGRSSSAGFSAIELLIVLAIAGCVAAISIPASTGMVDEFRLSGDAHGVSNSLAMARMNAAANFTRARVYIDRAANAYRIERWNKAAAAWQAVGGTSPLGSLNTFSSGAVAAPPPNSQVAVGQPTACLNDAGAAIANTSCVIFNSRGVPIDSTGAPTPATVIYLSGPTAVFGVVVSSTSQLAMWRIPPTGATWAQK